MGGQAMLVPVSTETAPVPPSAPAHGPMPMMTKAALATSGLLAVGGLTVAGVIMGDVFTGGDMISSIGDGGATIADHAGQGVNDFATLVDDLTDATGDMITSL